MPAFTSCEEIVRRSDPDRYFAALFAPADRRPHLFALYALNHELAHAGEAVREPMLGAIRLEWWRETVEEARAGRPRNHMVARALAEIFAAHDLPQALFDAMVMARGFDASPDRFADFATLDAYADATSGNLMRLAARILGAGEALDALAREAGIAYAAAGFLRALPFHAARGKLFLPESALAAAGVSGDDVLAGRGGAGLRAVVLEAARHARHHLAAAHTLARPGRALAAFLPASLVPLYLKRMTRRDFDPFRHSSDVPLHRRQMALLGAMLRGRV